MHPIIYLFYLALEVLWIALIIWIIMSWLISFRVLNISQPLVYRIHYTLNRLFEPILRPIRRYMPDLGGIDISPIVLFLLISFLQYSLGYYF